MVEVKTFNGDKLAEFIKSDEYQKLAFIPISLHRAISHLNNPRLQENDIILLIAYEGKNMLGYLGVLPEDLRINGNIERGGFLSCLWIHPESRGKKVAQKLLEICFEKWNSRILVTEFTSSAKGLYDKTGIFNDLIIKEGIRIYMKSELGRILPEKKEWFKNVIYLLGCIDGGLNIYANLKLIFTKKSKINLTAEKVNQIDSELQTYISQHNKNELFQRSKEELNWILNFPWVLSGLNSDPLSSKYHFTSVANEFKYIPIVLRNAQNKIVAFALFSKRNDTLKLPYCYYDSDKIEEVLTLVQNMILDEKCKTFTTFLPVLIERLQQKSIGLYKKKVKRHFIISKFFPDIKEPFEIQDGDADCVFT